MTFSDLKIYTDGGARGNPGPSACAFVIISEEKVIFKKADFLGVKTNNEAEYLGVIKALEWLKANKNLLSESGAVFFLDSELVVRQISGVYKVKSINLLPLLKKVKKLFRDLKIKENFISVSREKNKLADKLLNEKIDEKNG